MPHAAFDRAFDQRARIGGVVAVIAERIAHRIRHHDRGGEMDDRLDVMLADELRHQRLVAGLADDERHAFGDRPAMAGGQIVEHDDAFAGIGQFQHHLAADIAGAAGDQNRHGLRPVLPIAPAYTDSMNTPLCRRCGRHRGSAASSALPGRPQGPVRRDVAHAAVMAEPADRLVAGPAGSSVVGLDDGGQRIERRPVPGAGRPEYADRRRAERRRDVQQAGIVGHRDARRRPAPGWRRADRGRSDRGPRSRRRSPRPAAFRPGRRAPRPRSPAA